MVGKAALDNPDLPIDYVRDLLVARAEGKALATPFVPQGRACHRGIAPDLLTRVKLCSQRAGGACTPTAR